MGPMRIYKQRDQDRYKKDIYCVSESLLGINRVHLDTYLVKVLHVKWNGFASLKKVSVA